MRAVIVERANDDIWTSSARVRGVPSRISWNRSPVPASVGGSAGRADMSVIFPHLSPSRLLPLTYTLILLNTILLLDGRHKT